MCEEVFETIGKFLSGIGRLWRLASRWALMKFHLGLLWFVGELRVVCIGIVCLVDAVLDPLCAAVRNSFFGATLVERVIRNICLFEEMELFMCSSLAE